MVLTAVEKVALRFGTKEEQKINFLSIFKAQSYLREGEFPKGSMGPKVEAIVEFLENGGAAGLITRASSLTAAMAGRTGTWFYSDEGMPDFVGS